MPDPTALRSEPVPAAEQPRLAIVGIDHLTLICAEALRTLAFYRDTLGLTLVADGLNVDDSGARHLRFELGATGQQLTFLEYRDLPHGSVGTGSTHHIALRVASADELPGWRAYFEVHGVSCSELYEREGVRSIYLRDPDGHLLELTAPLS